MLRDAKVYYADLSDVAFDVAEDSPARGLDGRCRWRGCVFKINLIGVLGYFDAVNIYIFLQLYGLILPVTKLMYQLKQNH